MGQNDDTLEALATQLVSSGEYRVLRRLVTRTHINIPDGTQTRSDLFVDVETTGLDSKNDEIIELAMVPFSYSQDGRIFEIGTSFQGFQEPSKPISQTVTDITGITNKMVRGQRIDSRDVSSFVSDASLIIAHNANFDRQFVERLNDFFITKPWACSMSQVDWAGEGHEGSKLAYLAADAGFFYDRHRAKNDCLAAIELLGRPLAKSGIVQWHNF